MRHSIATVCLSGSLEEKMDAAAEAGFDGVEIFEPDLVVSELSPEEIRARADRLGLTLDLYQPFRDFEGVEESVLVDNLRRAEERFRVMNRLGMDTMLVCSNVATATVDSDEVSAAQLRRLGELAASYGVRVAFEALAWGTFVSDYRRAWRIVELADHPAVGTCLDSFHILSRGHDPSAIEQIPGEKIFFVQLADAPRLSMDVLSWSRHHRLFPGEGSFDLVGFVGHLVRAGYTGPLSLEVFNDVFRQTDTLRTARHARRSLTWLEDQAARERGDVSQLTAIAEVQPPAGIDYVEVKAEDTSAVETLLGQLGLTFRGQHRTKPVRLWSAGDVRIVLNEQHARDQAPSVAGIGLQVADAAASATRAAALGVRPVPRRTQEGEQVLTGFAAPSGLEVFVNDHDADAEPRWVEEFEHGGAPAAAPFTGVDHVNLVHTWSEHDEAVLFWTSLLGLQAPPQTEVASPQGLVRSQVMRSSDGAIRLPMNVAPATTATYPEHIALSCTDIVAVASAARARGLRFLRIPDNYYDDLRARFGLAEDHIEELRSHDLLYDRDAGGEFLHFYTPLVGRVFLEVVQRDDGYDGYGAANAPVRLAAQRRHQS
ncbi:bifunctional sugar phosphate isomerase/epimerase/4-hydroxyphenylpyruvate dioxygenase family protein [Nocardioides sambongensis]|uniref:bifunctional sugar phosphate isomerase/epimerase/4-hydroxyphenylpyruvate dioxygenase family protein n=1 Tax=Nocardioides sambongensis TaxID=2589074 RepID=UPI00112C359D|nr:sugar phosphate isomerase/epimerase and 4-hydroxyphenylpyruvate domain-containing protein [Nocardioides sambongensis]